MRIARLCLLMGVIAALASTGAVSAQTVLKPVPEQSSRLDNPSTAAKVKTWTRTRWEAARKRWARDNAKFYGCSDKWREQTKNQKYSLHDQREFLFQCMSDGKSLRGAN